MKYDINLIDFCAQSELILVRTYAIYIPLILQVLISFRAVKGCLKYGWTLIVLEKKWDQLSISNYYFYTKQNFKQM